MSEATSHHDILTRPLHDILFNPAQSSATNVYLASDNSGPNLVFKSRLNMNVSLAGASHISSFVFNDSDNLSAFIRQPLLVLMHCEYPSLSPSSHASSILRAVIVDPTPSAPSAIAVPVNPPNILGSPPGPCSCTPTPPPYPAPAYKLCGLDNSPLGSSDAESTAPAYERLDPLVLPTPPPGPLWMFSDLFIGPSVKSMHALLHRSSSSEHEHGYGGFAGTLPGGF
ncbi:hypothetical protein C8R43DRAFT_1133252 [Mycena crocata]|nr:hypothetical protein C8R43DRAFT_1133252 [Mycena crocata]